MLVEESETLSELRIHRKFEEMAISPDLHPFFECGPFYCRHVLDEHSPLLRPSIRQKVRGFGGWPIDLNDAAKIHDCLSKDVYEIVSSLERRKRLFDSRAYVSH